MKTGKEAVPAGEKRRFEIDELVESGGELKLKIRVWMGDSDSGWCRVRMGADEALEFLGAELIERSLARAIAEQVRHIRKNDVITDAVVVETGSPGRFTLPRTVELRIGLKFRGRAHCRVSLDERARVAGISGKLPEWLHEELAGRLLDRSRFEQVGRLEGEKGKAVPVMAGLDGLDLGWVYAEQESVPPRVHGPFNPADLDDQVRSFLESYRQFRG